MGKSLKTSQRTIAAVSIASLALLNVGIMAPAYAAEELTAPVVDDSDSGAKVGEPDSLESMPNDVTLKIHKFTQNNRGDAANAANGTAVDAETLQAMKTAGSKPIKGVTFTAYRIQNPDGSNLDITTNEGWKKANAISNAWAGVENKASAKTIEVEGDFAGTYKIAETSTATVTTGDDGVAKFQVSGDQRGFYLIKESISGNVQVGDKTVKGTSIAKAAPFIVALPMTDQKVKNKWLGTVNVYPKNSETDVTKKVNDISAPGVGNGETSNIEYTIKTGIPKNTALDAYELVDPLDNRLEYQRSEISIVDANDNAVTIPGGLTGKKSTEDATGADYLIYEEDAEPYTANPADSNDKIGKWITIQFTKDGRTKLEQAAKTNPDNDLKVKWVLTAKLTQAITGGDTIDNQAYLIPDNEGSGKWHGNDRPTTPPGNPSTAVVSKYGKVTINKVPRGGGDALGGATFHLYTCKGNETLEELKASNQRVSVKGVNEWVTASATDESAGTVQGQVSIDGLQLNDFVNGTSAEAATVEEAHDAAVKAAADKAKAVTNSHYCLVETKAPAGYELLPEPVSFQLLDGDSTAILTQTIENVPNNGGFDLPLTGGKGIFGLIALGALLVLGSIGYIFFASRRQES